MPHPDPTITTRKAPQSQPQALTDDGKPGDQHDIQRDADAARHLTALRIRGQLADSPEATGSA